MQISSPLFLFLFLPLSLPVLPLCPPKYRKTAMTLISLAFLLLANLQAPWGFLPIGAVLLLVCLLVCLPTEIFSRTRLVLGTAIPLSVFFAARLAAELFPQHHTYPLGLGLITLGAISICVDRYRADATERETPLSVIGYLCFFPTLTLGPVLRYKQYLYIAEHARPTLADFYAGILLYIKGFLKRIAICPILFAALQSILSVVEGGALLPLPVLSVALLLSFLALYFTVSGITDMSRGLMALYGYRPPHGQGRFFNCASPHRMLSALLCSLDAFLDDYLATPLKRLLPGRWGKVPAALLVSVCTVLFYRTHPAVLAIAAPLLACAALCAQNPKYMRYPRRTLYRIPLVMLSFLCLSLLALSMMLQHPLTLFTLLVGAFRRTDPLALYHALLSFTHLNHLLVMLTALLLYAPLAYFAPRLIVKLPTRVRVALRDTGVLVALVALFLAILFLLPQFPQYAELTLGMLFA